MAILRPLVIAAFIIAAVSANNIKQQKNEAAELEEYIAQKRLEINPRYRLHYHVAPPVGWMNDPNGFSFFKGEYHLFYQFYPYDSVWGPMHWGHVVSSNLVHWKELPTALIPGEEECFSGSAVVDGDTLYLMYTAHKGVWPNVNQSQYLAFSEDGVHFTKYEGNPVIPSAPNLSPDFRDPKVWKYQDFWYVVVGSKTEDGERGTVLLYRSSDLISWEFLNVIGQSSGNLGYMWECPDFFEMDGKFILLISPQGMIPEGDRYKNTHQTGYLIGSFSYETFEFVPEGGFKELDFGHDFYAAQTMEKDGKRILVSWMGMWEVPIPEAVDGWAGAMTISRELYLVGDLIIQKPVEAMTSLRESPQIGKELRTNQCLEFEKTAEIIVSASLNEKIELLMTGTEGGGKVWIRWDPDDRRVVLDRGSDDIRQVYWTPLGSHILRIFLDTSSIELFCGEGDVVFSSRVYPDGNWRFTNLSPQTIKVDAYRLNTNITASIPPPLIPSPSSAVRGYPLLGVVFLVILPLLSFKSHF